MEPLHTDTPDRGANLTAEDYRARQARRAEHEGQAGLHVIPDEYLAKAEADLGGGETP